MANTSQNNSRNTSNTTDPGQELGKAGNKVIDEAGKMGTGVLDKVGEFFHGEPSSNNPPNNNQSK